MNTQALKGGRIKEVSPIMAKQEEIQRDTIPVRRGEELDC